MALSLESIYTQISDFFTTQFKTDDESPVFFKFDKFGSRVSDKDFINVENPGDATLAQETFSDLVNFLPIADSDGVNIFFASNLIDSEYSRILGASIPFVDPLDPNKAEIISSFNKIKSNANLEWEKLSLPRGGGIMDLYRVSFGSPSDWYNRSNNQNWTEHSFEIKESESKPARGTPAVQWRYKLDNDRLKRIFPSFNTEKDIEPVPPGIETARRTVVRDHRTNPEVIIRDHTKPQAIRDHRTGVITSAHKRVFGKLSGIPSVESFPKAIDGLSFKEKRAVMHYVRENAPTQPFTANSIKINFKFCKIAIRRPWLMDSFTRNKSWFIPGSTKGQENLPGSDVNLSMLPIAFIAIKDLSIESNWSQQEVNASKDGNATSFGPFEVSTEIIGNKIAHEGIQIIGWILQRMPELPPNDPPPL